MSSRRQLLRRTAWRQKRKYSYTWPQIEYHKVRMPSISRHITPVQPIHFPCQVNHDDKRTGTGNRVLTTLQQRHSGPSRVDRALIQLKPEMPIVWDTQLSVFSHNVLFQVSSFLASFPLGFQDLQLFAYQQQYGMGAS